MNIVERLLILMSEHPFLKNFLGTPLLVPPPPPRRNILKEPSAERSPPQEEKHVRFAQFTRTHEGFDFETMRWVNYGFWSTCRPSQFRAGELVPFAAAKEKDG